MSDWYTDAEVDDMTSGLVRNKAKIDFLRRLGLRVHAKPNGRPLVWRPSSTVSVSGDVNVKTDSVVKSLAEWARKREGRHGAKA